MKCNDTAKYAGTGSVGLSLPFNMYYYPSSEHGIPFWQFPFATHSPTGATIHGSKSVDLGRAKIRAG